MGLIVIEIKAQDVYIIIAGISLQIFFFAVDRAIGRICYGKVINAFFAHKIINGISEQFLIFFV